MVPKPQISISNEPMSPVNEVSMCTVCDETMTPTNCYKPVPGVNTILACGEKTRVDEDVSALASFLYWWLKMIQIICDKPLISKRFSSSIK